MSLVNNQLKIYIQCNVSDSPCEDFTELYVFTRFRRPGLGVLIFQLLIVRQQLYVFYNIPLFIMQFFWPRVADVGQTRLQDFGSGRRSDDSFTLAAILKCLLCPVIAGGRTRKPPSLSTSLAVSHTQHISRCPLKI